MPPFRIVPLLAAALTALALLSPRPAPAADPAVPASAPADVVPGDAAAPAPSTPAAAAALPRGAQRDDVIRDARDAFSHHDRARLANDRAIALASRHPLAEWVDYWELANRLTEIGSDEVDAFYARWPNTYLEDRFRNDWLLEAGRRRDWAAFSRDYPRFRMNDDREVTCYALLVDHLAGKDVRDAARSAWMAQRDADDGCQLLAQTLLDDKVFVEDDVWRRLRQTAIFGRSRAAHAAAQLLGKPIQKLVDELWDNPARFLAHRSGGDTARRSDLAALALARMAATEPAGAALQLSERFQGSLGGDLTAWAWAAIARQGAQALMPEAVDWQARAWEAFHPRTPEAQPDWDDDLLAWHARALLRAGGGGAAHWRQLQRTIDAMSPAARGEDTWIYWRAKAQIALTREHGKDAYKEGAEAQAARAEADAALGALANNLSFYGLLAAEDLGSSVVLPPRPPVTTPAERTAARANPGLQRALLLAGLDLRDESRREWNYTLRGLGDRELLAAAQLACEASDWQLCINTSERTRSEVDVAQRYPTPYQRDITAAAQDNGLEPAFVFGLIRQETRFMNQIRSHVGASGLMQLMPGTAKWVAKKGDFDYRPDQIGDAATNLRLGTFYLKMLLDSFGGSQPMAAAAYNAGPGRPRRWRGTLMEDPAVWIENVPFYETRDYVKKVIVNSAVYAAQASGRPLQLRLRLGPQIGPRDAEQSTSDLP